MEKRSSSLFGPQGRSFPFAMTGSMANDLKVSESPGKENIP
jgi:hypothetical protein